MFVDASSTDATYLLLGWSSIAIFRSCSVDVLLCYLHEPHRQESIHLERGLVRPVRGAVCQILAISRSRIQFSTEGGREGVLYLAELRWGELLGVSAERRQICLFTP